MLKFSNVRCVWITNIGFGLTLTKSKIVVSHQIGSPSRFQGNTSCKGYFTRIDLCLHARISMQAGCVVRLHAEMLHREDQKSWSCQLTSRRFTPLKRHFPSNPTLSFDTDVCPHLALPRRPILRALSSSPRRTWSYHSIRSSMAFKKLIPSRKH